MGAAGGLRAPTVVIDTVLVFRPYKILAVMCGVVAILFLILSIAASAWITADGTREGLWERCIYNQTDPDFLHCGLAVEKNIAWRTACQGLCLTTLVLTFIAIIFTTVGLRSTSFKVKYKLYWIGLVVFLIAAAIQLTCLIIFPIKFLDDVPNRDEVHWNFGWAYTIGWCAALADFGAGILLVLDQGNEEILYKERILQDEDCNGIEACEDV